MLLVKDGRDNDAGMVSSVCQNHDGCPPLTDSRREEWHAGRAGLPGLHAGAPLRSAAPTRSERVGDALTRLAAAGQITRRGETWVRVDLLLTGEADRNGNGSNPDA
jgi:hypothetical protein